MLGDVAIPLDQDTLRWLIWKHSISFDVVYYYFK